MLTKNLYETHVYTKNLDEAISFYKKIGLTLAYTIKERKVAFFWIGDAENKEQMLGVWEVPAEQWRRSHFAFRVTKEEIVTAIAWLAERGISPRPSFGKEATEPLVHTWMPAASVYFQDLDGNSLEFLAVLPEPPQPEHGVLYLSEWEKIST